MKIKPETQKLITATDIEKLANQFGLLASEVEQSLLFQDAFDEYAGELRNRFPNQISGTWKERMPATAGHIRFTGEIPPEVTAEISNRSLLGPDNVILHGGGVFSHTEHLARQTFLAEALASEGYKNLLLYYEPDTNLIEIQINIPKEREQPSKAMLVDAWNKQLDKLKKQKPTNLPIYYSAGITLNDIKLSIRITSKPIYNPAI